MSDTLHTMERYPTPACIFLSTLPKNEVQRLKANFSGAWNTVDVKPPDLKDFHYIPWSGILGSNATLRQIYHLGRQMSLRTGRSTCLLLDAMSGLSNTAYLARYDANDKLGPTLRIGKIKELSKAAHCVMNHENGFEDSEQVYLQLELRDPELPIETASIQIDRTLSYPNLGFADLHPELETSAATIPMLCVVKFSHEDVDNLYARITKFASISNSSYTLIPWKGHEKASRAMMYRVATQGLKGDRRRERQYRYLIFIDQKTKKDGSMLLSRFINLDDTGGNCALRRRLEISRIPVTAFNRFWEAYRDYLNSDKAMVPDSFSEKNSYLELIRNPDIPLSVRRPLYLHQGRRPDKPFILPSKVVRSRGISSQGKAQDRY